MRGLVIVTATTVLAGCLDMNDKFMDPTEMPPPMTTTTVEPPTSEGPGPNATSENTDDETSAETSAETTAMPTTQSVPTMSMDTDTGPVCGNGVPEAGEGCDDGDGDDNNACTNACKQAICGDGSVWAGMEACDDGNDVNSDDCTEKCETPACGDGYMQAPEECDDGDNDDFDGCDADCAMTRLNVFVTSQAFKGDLEGLLGAAAMCNDAAMAADLPGPIKYKAWLSDNMNPAATQILHNDEFGVYVRPDGMLVADSWAALTSGELQAPINVTEWGGDPPASAPGLCGLTTLVYTNTTINGSVKVQDYDCNKWMMTMGPAAFGNYEATDETWTDACAQMAMGTCSTLAPIYCVQEPLL